VYTFRFLALGLVFLVLAVIAGSWPLAVIGVLVTLAVALVMRRRVRQDRALAPDEPIPGQPLVLSLRLGPADGPGTTVKIPVVRQEACFLCHGGGKASIGGDCATCSGKGRVPVQRTLKLKLPDDLKERAQIQIAGKGEPGLGGGPAGDLYVQFEEGGSGSP
jgi:hypothetical protein